MSRIELASGVLDDFERILDHLARLDSPAVRLRIDEILHAVDVLASNPLIGRPAPRDLRELVIGRDRHGYVALYRYVAPLDTVFVLAIRAQKEVGYAR